MEGFVLFVCACVQRCRAPLFGAKYGWLDKTLPQPTNTHVIALLNSLSCLPTSLHAYTLTQARTRTRAHEEMFGMGSDGDTDIIQMSQSIYLDFFIAQ